MPEKYSKQSESLRKRFEDEEFRSRWVDIRLKSWENPSKAMLSTLSRPKYKSAYVYSPYENKEIHLDSSWEQKFFSDIQKDKTVVNVIREGFSIKYISPEDNKIHSYFPDFLVEYSDGRKEIIEIKASYKLSDPKVILKINAAMEYCSKNDILYKVLTESNYKF